MRKTVKKMLLVSVLGSMCFVGKSQCEDICGIKQSANGLCTICYNECSDTGQTTYLSCSIAMGEEGQEQQLTQTMCKGLCYPQEFPQLQVDMASLTQASSAIVEQQNENEVEGQQNLLTQNQNMVESQGQIEPSLMFEEQLPVEENQQIQNEEVDNQELYPGSIIEDEEIAEFDGEMTGQDKEIGGWNEQTNGQEGEQIIEESGQNYQNGQNQEDHVNEEEENWEDEQNIYTEEQQNLPNEQQENYDQNEEVYQDMDEVEQNNLQEEEEDYEQEDNQQFQDNQQYQQQEQQQQLKQEQEQQEEWKQDQVYQQEENVQTNPSLTSQQETNLQNQQSNDQQQTQQKQTQQPVTSTQQTSNTQQQQAPQSVSSEKQPQMTVQQLKKLKQQTQGWVPTNQNLLKILLLLIISSITFVIAFTQIYKCVDKKRKLKQLQQKHNKEWVKCFQKVANSDTTIGSISSRQYQTFSTQEVQKQPETN